MPVIVIAGADHGETAAEFRQQFLGACVAGAVMAHDQDLRPGEIRKLCESAFQFL